MGRFGMDDYGGDLPSSEAAQWQKIDMLIYEASDVRARLSVAESQIKALTETSDSNRKEARQEAKEIIEAVASINKKLDQAEGGLRIGRYIVRFGIAVVGAVVLFKGGDWVGGIKAIAAGIAGQ